MNSQSRAALSQSAEILSSRARKRLGVVFLFVAPALVLYSLYTLYPVVTSVWYSLLDWNGIGASKFVGLDNWRQLLHDDNVLSSLRNTLVILAASFAVEIPAGLALALLVKRLGRLGSALSSIFILPLLMSSVAIGITWSFLYNPQFGPLYYIFNAFGQQAPGMLGDANWAIWAVTVVILWQYIPLYMLLFNAGLMAIPSELYDSASIDGASGWARFWWITLPLLRRTVITASVLILTGSLVYFDLVYVMTGGGPATRPIRSPCMSTAQHSWTRMWVTVRPLPSCCSSCLSFSPG